jgi:A/G-specific adenine glycosylase
MESPDTVTEQAVGGKPPEPLAAAEIPALRRELLAFFDRERRDLPWRETDDPYAIWVSEIMAQQTRVETVVPYYRAWLEAFPTVGALARADEAQVLKRWEGLGYYSRARNLHRAARLVHERFDGEVPATVQGLRELPGVGPYTAGAVASIAFGVPVPAIDGNVKRVFARLFDDPAPTPARLRRWGDAVVDPERPGDFNQALMELGATVCTPRSPTCMLCPVAAHCRALAAGTVAERPAPTSRRPVPHHDHAVLVAVRREAQGSGPDGGPGGGGAPGVWRVRLEQRPDGGLLAGMWAFPAAEGEAPGGDGSEALRRDVMALVRERGMVPRDGLPVRALAPVRHVFSHLRVTYHPHVVHVAEGGAGGTSVEAAGRAAPAPVAWIPPREPAALALPVAQQKILAQVARALADR